MKCIVMIHWAAAIAAVAAIAAAVAMGVGIAQAASVTTVEAAKELVLDLGNKVAIKCALIPAGKFLMGSPEYEKNRAKDEVQHEVTISKPFHIGMHEVTRGQFAAFVKDAKYRTEADRTGRAWAWDGKVWHEVQGASWKEPGFDQTDEHPVVCVSWNDAVVFCKWLGGKTGKTVRLPTEAEWEYACRAGTRTAYQWGNDQDDGKGWCNGADKTAKKTFPGWTVFNWDDGYVFTAPVAQFKANGFGLYDMHGNVWEWCEDWYGEYAEKAQTNPTGPARGHGRVVRGGAWDGDPSICRSASRVLSSPGSRSGHLGFRVVCGAGVD